MSTDLEKEQEEFDAEAVHIAFETRADIIDMTDEDLRTLGEFVREVAADARERQKKGLA